MARIRYVEFVFYYLSNAYLLPTRLFGQLVYSLLESIVLITLLAVNWSDIQRNWNCFNLKLTHFFPCLLCAFLEIVFQAWNYRCLKKIAALKNVSFFKVSQKHFPPLPPYLSTNKKSLLSLKYICSCRIRERSGRDG